MPWEKKYDETELVAQAMRAFWAHGYEATSVNDLVKATGVNRGSLYAAFSDKRSLFLEALRHYDTHHREGFLSRLARDHDPREAIIVAFECAARSPSAGDDPAGCLAVNTALEVAPHDPEVRDFVQGIFDHVEDFFFRMIESAKRDGTLTPSPSSRATAQALLGLFLGLRVLTRSGADQAIRNAITSQARTLLE